MVISYQYFYFLIIILQFLHLQSLMQKVMELNEKKIRILLKYKLF